MFHAVLSVGRSFFLHFVFRFITHYFDCVIVSASVTSFVISLCISYSRAFFKYCCLSLCVRSFCSHAVLSVVLYVCVVLSLRPPLFRFVVVYLVISLLFLSFCL